jgi:hypothetical protein
MTLIELSPDKPGQNNMATDTQGFTRIKAKNFQYLKNIKVGLGLSSYQCTSVFIRG